MKSLDVNNAVNVESAKDTKNLFYIDEYKMQRLQNSLLKREIKKLKREFPEKNLNFIQKDFLIRVSEGR